MSGSAGWTYDNNFRTSGRTVNGANALSFGYDAEIRSLVRTTTAMPQE